MNRRPCRPERHALAKLSHSPLLIFCKYRKSVTGHAPHHNFPYVPTVLKYIYEISGNKETKDNQSYAQDIV